MVYVFKTARMFQGMFVSPAGAGKQKNSVTHRQQRETVISEYQTTCADDKISISKTQIL